MDHLTWVLVIGFVVVFLACALLATKDRKENFGFQEYIYIPPQMEIEEKGKKKRKKKGRGDWNPWSIYGSGLVGGGGINWGVGGGGGGTVNTVQQPLQQGSFPLFPWNRQQQPLVPVGPPATTSAPAPSVTTSAPTTTKAPAPGPDPAPATVTDDGHDASKHISGPTNDSGIILPGKGPGDIPYLDVQASTKTDPASDYFGFQLNKQKLDEIGKKLNILPADQITAKLESLGIITVPPHNEREVIRRDSATYMTIALAAKLAVLPIEKANEKTGSQCFTIQTDGSIRLAIPSDSGIPKTCTDLAKCYGRLKGFAMKGNLKKVQEVMAACGGDQKTLTNDELVYLWGLNEHHNLHSTYLGKNETYGHGNAAHLTSLNEFSNWRLGRCENYTDTKPMTKTCIVNDEDIEFRCEHPKFGKGYDSPGDGSICEKGWMGFYNDTGLYAQWDAIRDAYLFKKNIQPYKS